MARIESWYKQDLKKPVPIRRMETVFNQDALGHLFGVEVYSNGEPVTLAGSVTGYCLLADGTTVPVSGTRSANKASIVIPQTAYSVIGPITITVKLTEGSAITTLLAVVGMVARSRTGQQVNPGSTITDWTNQIAQALQDVEDASAAQDAKIGDLNQALMKVGINIFTSSGSIKAKFYEYSFEVGKTYRICNLGSGTIVANTSDGADMIETISPSLEAGKTIAFIPSSPASHFRVYYASRDATTVTIESGNIVDVPNSLMALRNSLYSEFDETSTYQIGDYCFHANELKKCTVPITSPGPWAASKWETVTVTNEIRDNYNDLEERISDIQAVIAFDKLASLQAATYIKSGDVVTTLGYYSMNDGGGGQFLISDEPNSNYYYVKVRGGLYALLLNENNVNQCGAVGDGGTDNADIFESIINRKNVLHLLNGTYVISRPIICKTGTKIIGERNSIISRSASVGTGYPFAITLGGTEYNFGTEDHEVIVLPSTSSSYGSRIDNVEIKNINIRTVYPSEYCILAPYSRGVVIENVQILNAQQKALYIGGFLNTVSNVLITGSNAQEYYGIYILHGSNITIKNTYCSQCSIVCQKAKGIRIENTNCDDGAVDGACFSVIENSMVSIVNSGCEAFINGIFIDDESMVNCTGCMFEIHAYDRSSGINTGANVAGGSTIIMNGCSVWFNDYLQKSPIKKLFILSDNSTAIFTGNYIDAPLTEYYTKTPEDKLIINGITMS